MLLKKKKKGLKSGRRWSKVQAEGKVTVMLITKKSMSKGGYRHFM